MKLTEEEKQIVQKELEKNFQIVQRLKKQIEELAEGSYLKTELQKILGEKK